MQYLYVRIGPTSDLAYRPESFGAFISRENIKLYGIHILHSRCLPRATIYASNIRPSSERADRRPALVSRSFPSHREAISRPLN